MRALLRGRGQVLAALTASALLIGCVPDRAANVALLEDFEAQRAQERKASTVEPQRSGTLNVGTVYLTLSALSWNPSDWAWKANHDTGMYFEQLIAGDLDKSVTKGGRFPFRSDAYIPDDAMRGELAETWEWEDDLTLVVTLRRGVLFPAKEGVMQERELDAHDVVQSFERITSSPKAITGYLDFLRSITTRDDHTVVFEFHQYNAEWAYRFGYGYYSGIAPREIDQADANDWRNAVGSGPFQLAEYIPANTQRYVHNPLYWGTERPVGANQDFPIPFLDEVSYRIFKDPGTAYTALRTGKIDLLEVMSWLLVDHLKETTPELVWDRRLQDMGTLIALRVDQAPFDDLRVRRAMNMAIDKQEIVDLLHGGNGELFGFPMHPDFGPYYQPLGEMPAEVQELYTYDPERARELLKEAGVGEGLEFNVQVCACNPAHLDLAQVVADHLSRVGVQMTLEPLEYAAHLSMMTTRNHGPGYLMDQGHTNPTTSLRKNFTTGHLWNPSGWSDPVFDEAIDKLLQIRDEPARIAEVRRLNAWVVGEAPYLFLPTPYVYSAWWPWVRNYGGELRAGAVRPAPIYARIWIDHELKQLLGFS